MTVVVKNEGLEGYVFRGSAGKRRIEAGQTLTVADEEWQFVPTDRRGPGKLNTVGQAGAAVAYLFEYEEGIQSYEVKYLGEAEPGSVAADHVWTIKKFSYIFPSGAPLLTEVEVMSDVSWDDRDTLPWA